MQPPKNLKVLSPNSDIPFIMTLFNQALGVECVYCHQGEDYASDANPKKEISRKMIELVRQADSTFPSSSGNYPKGYHEVDCVTCHRGQVKVETKPPKEFFNRRESLGGGPPPPATPGTNLTVLPADTQVHGKGSVMEQFRDALNVDCAYCHGGGKDKDFGADENPRKKISRDMIKLVQQLNANFPGTGVYPKGNQAVTCYTCHRGSPHSISDSNRNFGPPDE